MTLLFVHSHDEQKAMEIARVQTLNDLETNRKIVEDAKRHLDNPNLELKEAKDKYEDSWTAARSVSDFLENPTMMFEVHQNTFTWVLRPGTHVFDAHHTAEIQ